MGNYNNPKNELYNNGKALLKMLNVYVALVEQANMCDEQFFIDFEDELNEISIKDHVKKVI